MHSKYNVVSDLQNYMFSKQIPIITTTVVPITPQQPPLITTVVPIRQPVVIKSLFFSPRGLQDTLFWCFYVMANGMVSYEKEVASFEKEKVEKVVLKKFI